MEDIYDSSSLKIDRLSKIYDFLKKSTLSF